MIGDEWWGARPMMVCPLPNGDEAGAQSPTGEKPKEPHITRAILAELVGFIAECDNMRRFWTGSIRVHLRDTYR